MSRWEKLLSRILLLDNDLRFEELQKVLESYGYVLKSPRGGSSHATFRKKGHNPITIPRRGSIKKTYVEMVRDVIEEEKKNEEESKKNRRLH